MVLGASPHQLQAVVASTDEPQIQRRQPGLGLTGDGGHGIVHRVSDRQQARHHRSGADAEIHVHLVERTLRQAVLQTLQHPEFEVDARRPTPRKTKRSLAHPAMPNHFGHRIQHPADEVRLVASASPRQPHAVTPQGQQQGIHGAAASIRNHQADPVETVAKLHVRGVIEFGDQGPHGILDRPAGRFDRPASKVEQDEAHILVVESPARVRGVGSVHQTQGGPLGLNAQFVLTQRCGQPRPFHLCRQRLQGVGQGTEVDDSKLLHETCPASVLHHTTFDWQRRRPGSGPAATTGRPME